ncbi:NBS-LRR-like resistance protein [Rhynchospora pubera]|uniref:NBS-LRR-like resistance protein n=1 Tax=Rhynchospora pubera TaxID=906938 RepID=A0AAV8GVI8_9POAL|nr:NBS-LRR-like resistance protein [Rhynchospora pubera]
MADLLVSALIPIVLKKAEDSLVQRLGEMWHINDQRERLHDMLLQIQAVVPHIEQGNSIRPIKLWLEKLKSAAYDADDLLDEFCYEVLRQDAVSRGQNVVNASGFFRLENPTQFRYKMSAKLKKLVDTFDGLVYQMNIFSLVEAQHVQNAFRYETCSYVDGSEVVGRDEDKENIMRLLLEESNNEDLKVVPVVGMGGVGKTTLVQLVYNDRIVRQYFNFLLWIHVSEDFNINRILVSIIQEVTGWDNNVPTNNMEQICRSLHEVLQGKRYLLVLDDVWNENIDEWERLRDLLNISYRSAVIVTTRSGRIASIMGTVASYNLGCLGENDSCNLFHQRAFVMGVIQNEELVEIGKKMVQNFGGLPLAISTLGRLMINEQNMHEWLVALKDSRIWETSLFTDYLFPVLRRSYDQLPPYMKQCFAFCAVFPKGYEMDKEKLIQYWMANGFIPSDGPGSLGMKGNHIFNELVCRSFFHDVKQVCPITYPYRKEDGHRSETKCKLHDLMYYLAQSIMGEECRSSLVLPEQLYHPVFTIRHTFTENIPLDINDTMAYFPSIRSLISVPRYGYGSVHDIGFFKSNYLRILDLDVNSIVGTRITPEKMKYLRYLEISGANTASFPEAISTLYLLQTLRLPECWNLAKLPEGMKYMSSLRHLHIENCYNLKGMPPGLGFLNYLEILTTYIIGPGPGNSIAELKNLNLHGKLHLYNLRKVRYVVDAWEAKLLEKHDLDELALCWGMPDLYRSANFVVEEYNDQEVMHRDPHEVLVALEPCNNLKVLQVTQYMGDEFPFWVREYAKLENLIELYIIDCRKCTKLPPVEKLPFIQILDLKFLYNVRHLCNSDFKSEESDKDARVAFQSLKSLLLSGMSNLCSWCEGEVGNETSLIFPELRRLNIINCPMLTALPIVPLIENLSIKGNVTLSCFATKLSTKTPLSNPNHVSRDTV